MFPAPLLLSLACVPFAEGPGPSAFPVHFPHDTVYSIATGKLANGVNEIVIVTSDQTRVLRSRDDGLTWVPIVGARLERNFAREVVFVPSATESYFVIGTNNGAWRYLPESEIVKPFTNGLPDTDKDVYDMDASLVDDGPIALLTSRGNVYFKTDVLAPWELKLDSGLVALTGRSAVAIAPEYNPAGTTLRERALFAGINGVLFFSSDGGATWERHDQFRNSAVRPTDWQITSMAFSRDYFNDGTVLIGRGAIDFNNTSEDIGEIWRSTDFGFSFQKVLDLGTAVSSLVATPPGPTGPALFLAAGNLFPNYTYYKEQGVFQSVDKGESWNDFGNHQDFVLERGPGNGTGEPLDNRIEQSFAISPDYATDGAIWYGRAEGLFQTRDSGVNWIQRRFRPTIEMRGLAAARDDNGNCLVFGACYGSSTIAHTAETGQVILLDENCPLAYQKAISASPNFRYDGTVIVTGARDIAIWYNPALQETNYMGRSGWHSPALLDLTTNERVQGYPRVLAVSPKFDSRGTEPGTDQTFYWNSWENPPMRTQDGGETVERLDQLAGGGEVPFMEVLRIAPTYDAVSNRSGVYGCSGNTLYRLDDTIWSAVMTFEDEIKDFVVDPTYQSPSNPRLFVLLEDDPFLVELLDVAGGAFVLYLNTDLSDLQVTGLTIVPNFDEKPLMFISTWGSGVWSLNLNHLVDGWQPVGNDFPVWWTDSIIASPNFANDGMVMVGTQYGFVAGVSEENFDWVSYTLLENWDNVDTGLTTFAPQDPTNLDPVRPWPWQEVPISAVDPNFQATEGRVLLASYDQSALTTSAYASRVIVQTYAGPGAGRIRLVVNDYYTGVELRRTIYDLANLSTEPTAIELEVDIGTYQAVDVVVKVFLDEGESFAFDGFTFVN